MPGERGAMKYRYVGKRDEGEHLSGVPAHHLYDADWDALPADLRREVERSAVYKKVEAEPEADAAAGHRAGAAAPSSKTAGGEKK